MRTMQRFWREEDGAAAIEYALIAALIALTIAGGVTALGGELGGAFDALSAQLKTAVSGASK